MPTSSRSVRLGRAAAVAVVAALLSYVVVVHLVHGEMDHTALGAAAVCLVLFTVGRVRAVDAPSGYALTAASERPSRGAMVPQPALVVARGSPAWLQRILH